MYDTMSDEIARAVAQIRLAILQSQERALKAINQEQLQLYYGIGRFISANTRKKNWGRGFIDDISSHLRQELPGLRGFSATNLKNMRLFYEAWSGVLENSSVLTDKFSEMAQKAGEDELQSDEYQLNVFRQIQLTNFTDFPIVEFFSISFSHHISILNHSKDVDERLFYIRYCYNFKPTTEMLPAIIKKQDLFHNQGALPNNFARTIADYKQAFRAVQMFKDEYLLDFINVEELGMRDEEIDERVLENSIVQNVKNFIMTFGKGFAFVGNQVHYDKLGHDHWVDLLFYNRELRRIVVFELKKGNFKVAYLAQLSAYLRILNDDERLEGENPPVGIILCKNMDKEYVNYIMQDFLQPMGVATYKTADEVAPDLLKVLPPKEELIKLIDEQKE
ncbi:MAG: DUF1016 family protein [Bacteroidaceae bacterium]|nr:DUF1016 family protein [Bacteroidaceae bacterium]